MITGNVIFSKKLHKVRTLNSEMLFSYHTRTCTLSVLCCFAIHDRSTGRAIAQDIKGLRTDRAFLRELSTRFHIVPQNLGKQCACHPSSLARRAARLGPRHMWIGATTIQVVPCHQWDRCGFACCSYRNQSAEILPGQICCRPPSSSGCWKCPRSWQPKKGFLRSSTSVRPISEFISPTYTHRTFFRVFQSWKDSERQASEPRISIPILLYPEYRINFDPFYPLQPTLPNPSDTGLSCNRIYPRDSLRISSGRLRTPAFPPSAAQA